jgi:hypothetical protein
MIRKTASDHPGRSPCSDVKIHLIHDLCTVAAGDGWLMNIKTVKWFERRLRVFNRDFPFGLLPTTGVGGFRDILPLS